MPESGGLQSVIVHDCSHDETTSCVTGRPDGQHIQPRLFDCPHNRYIGKSLTSADADSVLLQFP